VLANLKIILKISILVKKKLPFYFITYLVKHRNTVYTENQFLREDFKRLPKQKFRGTRWRSWLRQWAASRKVTGSIPDDRIFHRHESSGLILAPESTQPLTVNGTRNIS